MTDRRLPPMPRTPTDQYLAALLEEVEGLRADVRALWDALAAGAEIVTTTTAEETVEGDVAIEPEPEPAPKPKRARKPKGSAS